MDDVQQQQQQQPAHTLALMSASKSATDETRVEEAVTVLRTSFANKRTLPEAWRRHQLEQMKLMLTEGHAELLRALYDDFHRSDVEAYYTEVNIVEHEIQYMLDELQMLIRPQKGATNLFNILGRSRIFKDPLGVVMVMGCWHYPIQHALLPLVGAIAAGNCVLIKVSSEKYSKACSRTISDLCARYMDQDCIRVLEGDRGMTRILLQQRFDKIFFAGGRALGKVVCESAARNLTPATLLIGGKSPAIVCASADVAVAAKRIVWASFLNAGQSCARPDYVLVHESVSQHLLDVMKCAVLDFYGEDPQQSENFGRIVNADAHKRLARILHAARKKENATILIGGTTYLESLYIAPTILDYGDDDAVFSNSKAMSEEVFGPILPVFRFRDLQWAVDFVRTAEAPVSVYPFTTDKKEQELILRETSSGGCDVNDAMMCLSSPHLPFGGMGKSGMSLYHGASRLLFSFIVDSFSNTL